MIFFHGGSDRQYQADAFYGEASDPVELSDSPRLEPIHAGVDAVADDLRILIAHDEIDGHYYDD